MHLFTMELFKRPSYFSKLILNQKAEIRYIPILLLFIRQIMINQHLIHVISSFRERTTYYSYIFRRKFPKSSFMF